MPEAEYSVRGHSGGWDRSKPAGREYGSMMHFILVNSTLVEEAIYKEQKEEKEAAEQNKKYLEIIQKYPSSSEKRVISYGLYGSNPKYTTGAIKNAQLAKVCLHAYVRKYIHAFIQSVHHALSALHANTIELVPSSISIH